MKAQKKSVVTANPAVNAELVAQWIADAQVKPASVKAYEKGIKRLSEYCASNGISSITRETMIQYRAYLGAKYASPSTRNLYLTSAKLFLGFLHRIGYLPSNPAERIKGFKVSDGHKKSALQAVEVQAIAAHFDTTTLKGARDLAIFALMVTCGLRCIEVASSDVGDFEFVGGVIRLHVHGKGRDDKADAVTVPAGVYQLICEWLKKRGDVEDTAPLFTSLAHNSAGKRLTTATLSRIIKAAMRAAGMTSKRLTAHSLRHTAATLALKNGATLREVQENLRHKTIAVTLIYAHELESLANSATARTAAAIGF